MIVHVSRDLFIALRGVEDLKSFKMEIAAPPASAHDLALVLNGIATIDAEGYAWVSEDWMRRISPKAGDPQWQEALTGMIAYAATKGWTDPVRRTVRAHIEWLADDPT